MRAVTAVAGAFVVVAGVVACSISTGNSDGNKGGGPTTILNETFSSGSLSNWIILLGTPTISASVGNPVPSAFLSNADMKTAGTTTMTNGLTITADIRVDSGSAAFRLVQPGSPIAVVHVFRDSAVYVICTSSDCQESSAPLAEDSAWHRYRFVYDAGTSSGRWLRDGTNQYSVANVPALGTVFLKAGMFSKDTAGPSGGYYDNVVVTTP